MDESITGWVAICKNPDCEEEIPKDENGKYEKFCSMCGDPTGLDIVLECPKCGKSRNKSKSEKYAKFCGRCRHDYMVAEAIEDAPSAISDDKSVSRQTGATSADVSGSPGATATTSDTTVETPVSTPKDVVHKPTKSAVDMINNQFTMPIADVVQPKIGANKDDVKLKAVLTKIDDLKSDAALQRVESGPDLATATKDLPQDISELGKQVLEQDANRCKMENDAEGQTGNVATEISESNMGSTLAAEDSQTSPSAGLSQIQTVEGEDNSGNMTETQVDGVKTKSNSDHFKVGEGPAEEQDSNQQAAGVTSDNSKRVLPSGSDGTPSPEAAEKGTVVIEPSVEDSKEIQPDVSQLKSTELPLWPSESDYSEGYAQTQLDDTKGIDGVKIDDAGRVAGESSKVGHASVEPIVYGSQHPVEENASQSATMAGSDYRQGAPGIIVEGGEGAPALGPVIYHPTSSSPPSSNQGDARAEDSQSIPGSKHNSSQVGQIEPGSRSHFNQIVARKNSDPEEETVISRESVISQPVLDQEGNRGNLGAAANQGVPPASPVAGPGVSGSDGNQTGPTPRSDSSPADPGIETNQGGNELRPDCCSGGSGTEVAQGHSVPTPDSLQGGPDVGKSHSGPEPRSNGDTGASDVENNQGGPEPKPVSNPEGAGIETDPGSGASRPDCRIEVPDRKTDQGYQEQNPDISAGDNVIETNQGRHEPRSVTRPGFSDAATDPLGTAPKPQSSPGGPVVGTNHVTEPTPDLVKSEVPAIEDDQRSPQPMLGSSPRRQGAVIHHHGTGRVSWQQEVSRGDLSSEQDLVTPRVPEEPLTPETPKPESSSDDASRIVPSSATPQAVSSSSRGAEGGVSVDAVPNPTPSTESVSILQQYPLQELPANFKELKVKVDEANQLTKKQKVEFAEEDCRLIKAAYKLFNDKKSEFHGAVQDHKRAKTSNKAKKELKLKTKREELKSLVDVWNQKLQSSLRKVEEYNNAAVEHQQQVKQYDPRGNFKRIVFLATLHSGVKDAFSPVIEVKGWTGREWITLAKMNEVDGVLQGECLTIPKHFTTLHYRYTLYSKSGQLLQTEKIGGSSNSRQADFINSGDDVTLYDGLIAVNAPKGTLASMTSIIWTDNPYLEKLEAYHHMLPNWIERISDGKSAEQLKEQVEQATDQQYSHVSTFVAASYVRQEINRRLGAYLVATCQQHINLCGDENMDVNTIYLSMLRLFELVHHYVVKNATVNQLKDTVNFLSQNILNLFRGRNEGKLFQLTHTLLDDSQASRFTLMTLDFMNKLSSSQSSIWICVLPLLHAFKRTDADSQGNHMKTQAWWGTTGFDGLIQSLKSYHRTSWKTWLEKLQPFFNDCVVLPYTFMALLNREDFIEYLESMLDAQQQIPVNGVLACARHYIELSTNHRMKLGLYEPMLQYMKRMTNSAANHAIDSYTLDLGKSFLDSFVTTEQGRFRSRPTLRFDKPHIAAHIYLLVLEMYISNCGDDDVSELMDSLQAKLLLFLDDFRVAAATSPKELGNDEIMNWKLMFQCDVNHQRIRSIHVSACHAQFVERMELIKMQNPQHVIDLYLNNSFDIPEMDEGVSRSALSVADDILTGDSDQRFSRGKTNPKIYKLIDLALTKAWPEDDGDRFHLVRNLIEWGSFVTVCKFIYKLSDGDRTSYLDEANCERLAKALSSFEDVITKLSNGSISFQQYEVMKSSREKLIEFCEVADNLKARRDEITSAIDQRDKEVARYDRFVNCVRIFWECCRGCFTAQREMDIWLAREPTELTFQQVFDATTQDVVCDIIPDELRPCLEPFSQLIRRPMFHGIYCAGIREAGNTWAGVIQLYYKALAEYNSITGNLAQGTITIRNLEELANEYFHEDINKVIEELPELIKDAEVCDERRRQIEGSAQISQYAYGAEVLLMMKKEYNLEGDFTVLEQIAEIKNKNAELRNIDLAMLETVSEISHIGQSQADCLKAYIDCKDFVGWVKEAVEKKDISVFVDLAGSALGEDDLSAQKTRYLLNALNGYTPLLYDLDSGPKDLQSFLALCERVWSEQKANPELPNFLIQSAQELEFFKRVRSHFGNVEIATMAQATAINETGVYYVGNIHGFSKDFQSVDDVIQLKCKIKDKRGETEKKTYLYADLKELQGKLTLAAGDKQKDNMDTIQEFDAMRDAVENLAKAYIDIRREGCIQFDDLLVVVHCNPGGEAALEIKLQSIGKMIFGLKSDRTALQHCHDVYEYLNASAKAWRNSMDQKRSEIAELNYYTTEQLVMMRKDLGKFLYERQQGNSGSLDKAMPLLAMIHTVNPDDLFTTMLDFEETKDDSAEHSVVSRIRYYDEMTGDEQDKIADIEDLEGFTEELAIQVVNELGFEKTDDEYLSWNETRLADLGRAEDLKRMEDERTTDDVMAMIMEQHLGNSSLKKKLESLWNQFIAHTSKSIKNFLGIPHLGHILKRLEALKPQYGPRNLPTWLERGKPALIAVPKSETYSMVLTIYEADQAAPPPTRNDVLVCSKQTRTEEAVLFLNRALNDPKSFYCMVNCHLINYEVCRIIEQRLSKIADQQELKYGLAFIYDEGQKNARIRAHLDRHQVKNAPLTVPAKLKLYVAQLLTIPRDVQTASSVDPDWLLCRLIRSNVSGVGKSLLKSNLCNELRQTAKLSGKDVTIPIYKTIETDSIIKRLSQEPGNDYFQEVYHTIHLDIAYEVETGVDELLFNLIILRSVVNTEGMVWQARDSQYYIIECMPHMTEHGCSHEVVDLLPTTMCHTPDVVYKAYTENEHITGFDANVLEQQEWQTVLKFLDAYRNRRFRYKIDVEPAITSKTRALQLLLENCGLRNPTWAELNHYVHFLYNQLNKVSTSVFCQDYFANSLRGFKPFVVDFMLKMARDFATRSLMIAEESSGMKKSQSVNELENFEIKTTWEDSNRPYLFFNEDGESFTTLGFLAEKAGTHYRLLDCQTGEPFDDYSISRHLFDDLEGQQVSFSENFNKLARCKQLERLRKIMVNEVPNCSYNTDPNENYVLTMDNAKKIIAIHQRLRVGIPVIIMGETGCGKTLLIEFMSKLQVPTELIDELVTMVTVKIHGGTSEADIIGKVREAQALAKNNHRICEEYARQFYVETLTEAGEVEGLGQVLQCSVCSSTTNLTELPCHHVLCNGCLPIYIHAEQSCRLCEKVPKVYTVLFLDEANTTEAIGLVKEILCDKRMNGEALDLSMGLKIIAACNPYRKHTVQMIEKLQKAGLGYCVDAADTSEKIGKIPLRHLVYRVHALPQSLLPLVWDFGTLKSAPYSEDEASEPVVDVESAYIEQMIYKFENTNSVGLLLSIDKTSLIAKMLSRSQTFMRYQEDECSFVSLRDIQRLLDVLAWFYQQRELLYPRMHQLASEKESQPPVLTDHVVLSLILAIGVCYIARLEEHTRVKYAEYIRSDIEHLIGQAHTVNGSELIFSQIQLCQELFVNEVVDTDQHENIAKNKALQENVFMMIICIENKIPLFVVGKPGSSKSLSKSLVFDSMKGSRSKSELFKKLKATYMVSFQCSRHATPDGIIGVFTHCAKFQKDQDMDKFVSVVVLDEVGLAEDSENLPLKALHPLLEDGCEGNTKPEPYMKCAFIGISNWALDPAKMNRGIFVQRGSLDKDELLKIAREICGNSKPGYTGVDIFIKPLAEGFRDICEWKKPVERDMTEFFGLRDYYSVIKMVANFAKETGQLNKNQLIHSIKRNFGGFDPAEFDPMTIFEQHCRQALSGLRPGKRSEPPTNPIKLIDSCLSGVHTIGMESRYLLILTENLSVLTIILDMLGKHDVFPEVVFGSKFPDDVSYTQVCHNIFRIKTCMDLGKPVILLNLDDLYESLYDALNQYFSRWGDKKFVDIGLGTHRVKAFVNDGFRLIVIAEKNKVYSEFPIPLINRLEKHYVSGTSLLSQDELEVKEQLEEWMAQFVTPGKTLGNSCPFDCEGCKAYLSQPYKLPCGHYIGNCCKDKMFQGVLEQVCPVKKCGVAMDEEYEWRLCEQELLNRQYFENSSTTSAFIGYSSELTALAIKKAETEAFQSSKGMAQIYEALFEKSKFYLLQCATGESVLRLDKTMLKAESANLQRIYMEEQKHETLLQYLEHELPLASGNSLFIQVTSFSQLMGRTDVEELYKMLNSQEQVTETRSLYLKDFVRETQFTEKLRKFYWQKSTFGSKLMIVQCESGDENTELLDAVRYIIQRETSEAPLSDEHVTTGPSHVPNHTVLLLSLPRGHNFTGYQGGVWKCVQIDDPRSPMFRLPALNECLQLKPSDIIDGLLNYLESPAEEMDNMPPPLEGDTDEEQDIAIISDEDAYYPDTELPQAANTAITKRKFAADRVLPFIKHCIPAAMSIIKSSGPNGHVILLRNLLDTEEPEFLKIFLRLVYDLLAEQDRYQHFNWVKEDAVKASNMRTSETLRHAIEDAFERAIVPGLSAVISFIDVQHNLSLLKGEAAFKDLWLQIFEVTHKLGLNFGRITVAGRSKLPRAYKIQDAGRNMSDFETRFPFSWIVKESIESIQTTAQNVSLDPDMSDADQMEIRLLHLFEENPDGKVVTEYMNAENSRQLIDNYLHDFVYMVHPCRSETEHWIVQSMIKKVLHSRYEEEDLSVVHVHVVYHEQKEMMNNLTDILSIDLVIEGNISSIAEQVKEDLERADENTATFEPCDLVAIKCCLTVLASARIRRLQERPQEWIDQMDQAAAIMTVVFSPSANHEQFHALAEQCRNLWLQLEVKKLYTEHVILPSIPDSDNKRNSFKLNDLIQRAKDANFQSNETFQKVVSFLKDRVKDGVRALYPGCPRQCPMCETNLDSPVKLPCGHLICENCTRNNQLCASGECGAEIPVGYEYTPSEGSVELHTLQTFKYLRKRLNNFFMHFISKMVFSTTGTAPDGEVIEWLISRVYSESGSRAFTFYDSQEAVDASPVLRSFLLKLFLRCEQNGPIINSLDQMMTAWSDGVVEKQLPTMTMIIDCHKETFESAKSLELNDSVDCLMNCLGELISDDASERTVRSLKAIAEIQCHIRHVVEKILFTQNKQPMSDLEDELKRFLNQTREHGNCEPGYFVVRHLLQREGESYIKDLLNTPRSYLIPADIQELLFRFSLPDILSIYGGDDYESSLKDLRVVVAQPEDMGAIDRFYEDTKDCLIIGSFFTGVTRTFSENVPVPPQVRQLLIDKLPIEDETLQEICRMLLDPDRIPEGVDVKSSQGLNLFMLVLHLLSATHGRTGDLKPLVEIISDPEQAAAHLFPTMEDNQIDVQREAQKDHPEEASQYGNESIMYYCPNGHPYLIGDCGRPWGGGKCLCGADIGGADLHVSATGNVRPEDQEQLTKNGHTLGSPATRIEADLPERELAAKSCAVLRCLTHLAMYTSALTNSDQVMTMINLERDFDSSGELERFLHQHIELDLKLISRCCAVSTDDCIILLHSIIDEMNACPDEEEPVHLSTLRERREWEAQFDSKYMKPTLDKQDEVITTIKEEIASANEASSLNEILDTTRDPINKDDLLASPGLWDYRRPLTLATIRNKIQSEEYPILKMFVERCYQLIAIRCLPDIIALTQLLSDKFHSRFSRQRALRLNVDEFCREYDNAAWNLRGKMDQFIKAWNIMVQTINSGAVAQVNLEKLPDNPPLAEFLFDIYSLNKNSQSNRASIGAAPFILVTFLVDRHNDMLTNDGRERSTINLPKVISTNLVSISSEDEILDLVQSHCEYALGDTSAVTYDWAAIDRELDMRYMGSKPRIMLTRSHLPSYMYQEDFSLLNQLKAIGESQERLQPELEVSITNSLIINVQTLTDHLKELQVIVNFLSAMPHIEKEKSLAEFVRTTFGSEREVTYLAAEVKLKHVRHVWFLLKYTQASRLMEQRQEPFDDVEPSYRKELSDNLIAKLRDRCLYNSPRTKFLLQILFEFIILRLNRAVTADFIERENIDKSLGPTLVGYVVGQDNDSLMERIADLPELPAGLLVDHSARAWCHIWEMFNTPGAAANENVAE